MTDTFTIAGDDFADPGTGSGGGGPRLSYGDLLGSLLLVRVHEVTQPITTQFGEATAVRADVAVLDGPQKGQEYLDTLIFPRKLQGQLAGSVGSRVLGRLEQGEKKPGKNPPWQLAAATEEEKVIARKYVAHVAAQLAATEEPF
jgi:hypothetical protein